MMARAKKIYSLIIKVNKLFSLKEIENMFSVFLSIYRNASSESLGELKKALETLVNGSCSPAEHFSFSQTSPCVSIKQLDYELEISRQPPRTEIESKWSNCFSIHLLVVQNVIENAKKRPLAHTATLLTIYHRLLKTVSLDNAIREFSLA